MPAPRLIKSIPTQIINEQAAFSPFDLKAYVEADGKVMFQATTDGNALPKGMICTAEGLLTGIPAKGTQGNYRIQLLIQNEAGSLETEFALMIKPSFAEGIEEVEQIKSQIWQALEQNLPVPELEALYGRPISMTDVYYLLERWATLTIWDAFNLDPAGSPVKLTLEGASPHYHIYDRGSCLVAAPKELFSHERTLIDTLQTARAMAREVYKRQWTIEMAGFEKMVRAAWVEIQLLGEKHGKPLEILHFDPTFQDIKVYNEEMKQLTVIRPENV